MNVDGALGGPLAAAGELARHLEIAGYTGGWTAETNVDPFLPHVLAAEHTTSLELGTAMDIWTPHGLIVAGKHKTSTLGNLGGW